ncbi:MAG: acetyl-CoA carboxylase biotin carboxyl carrier protein [Ruminococcaceae bacterium]|nr:acetyl-CoA carboxylase biotin carboxyl carrier protein [Oscillospiraceae bacterium]
MDINTVKQLAELMDAHGLTRIEVCEGDHRVCLSKQTTTIHSQPPAAGVAPGQAAVPAAAGHPEGAAPVATQDKPGEVLTAPLVGMVYLSPEPGAKPFVAEGQRVKQGDTLCIIEAMKVMNEFTAPRNGVVAEICTENGQLAEFGQPLFRLL